jgi:SAM-dependent methyltransferase
LGVRRFVARMLRAALMQMPGSHTAHEIENQRTARAVCPLCASANPAVVYDLTTVDSAEDVPGLVMRCRACRMWFKLLSDPNGLPTAYPGEYGDDPIADTYLRSPAARRFFHDTLAKATFSAHGARPRLLDIGAAEGVLLEEAARMGFDAEGVDHCEANVHTARTRGLKMTLGAAETLDYRELFDVVTMIDLIEHLPDPLRALKAAHRALKPGGELVIYTPNHRGAVVVLSKLLHAMGVRHPIREIFGRNHVCFFDDRSLPVALNLAGFDVRLEERFPYDPSRPGQYMSPVSLAAVAAAEWIGRPFKRVFRMLVFARKPRSTEQQP